jgi:predicted transport protein
MKQKQKRKNFVSFQLTICFVSVLFQAGLTQAAAALRQRNLPAAAAGLFREVLNDGCNCNRNIISNNFLGCFWHARHNETTAKLFTIC